MRFGLTIVLLAAIALPWRAQALPPAVDTDPPADKAHPAMLQVVHIPAHGVAINGVLYTASGAGAHPAVVLLHGFPGNEQNLDLAQAIRRDGWTVLTLHYRGSWGSPGTYAFAHVFEDAQSALDFVRNPANAARYGIDTKHVVLIGHSLGGMAAAFVGRTNPSLAGVGLISAADFGRIPGRVPGGRAGLADFMAQNMESLAGVTPVQLAEETLAHAPEWDFVDYAEGLAKHRLLLVTSDDGLAADNDALGTAVRKTGGGPVTATHIATDHSYSDHRIALQAAVIDWLHTVRP